MIEVKNVVKVFEKNVSRNKKIKFRADDDISFTADKGETLGILGPNGAGKTTLLRMIAGIMEPTEGTITVDGMNYKKNATDIKKKIAFMSGNTRLYKDISAYELLKMCGDYYGLDDTTIEERIKTVTAEFEMEKFLHQRIGSLSTGQTQRVSLARCVVHNPQYYILDEATSGLDVISSRVVLNFMAREKEKGKCVIYSTHYMEEAEAICDRVMIINEGKIIASGTPDEIKAKTNASSIRDSFFALVGEINEKE